MGTTQLIYRATYARDQVPSSTSLASICGDTTDELLADARGKTPVGQHLSRIQACLVVDGQQARWVTIFYDHGGWEVDPVDPVPFGKFMARAER